MAGVPQSSRGGGLPLGLTGATAATRYVGATASGAPASGTFTVGDFSIDQTGLIFVCTVAGSPGTWVQVGGSTSALTLLSTTTRATDGTIDVSGISGAYNDLILVLIARSTLSATFDTLEMRFNNDSGNNYYTQRIRGAATTASAAESIAASTVGVTNLPGASATANLFGFVVVTLFGYASTTWTKMFEVENIAANALSTGAVNAVYAGGFWNNTAAITRVSAAGASAQALLTGSQLRIYGRL